MPRDDDFSDIPDLGPADEERAAQSIPTLQSKQAVKQKSKIEASAAAKPRSHASLWILVLVLAGSVGFSVFHQMQLKQQLAASERALLESQSRLADIETLVNATDESASKTDAVFLAQLKRQQQDREARIAHVDSEIRKLWAIYQKYKPTIDELEKNAAAQQKQLAGQQKELATVGGSLDSLGVSMAKQSESLSQQNKQLQQLKQSAQQLDKQLVALQQDMRLQDLQQQEVADMQSAELNKLQQALNQSGATERLAAQLNEQQQAIASINASRRQINAELLKLRNQLGQLQNSAAP